MSNLHINITSDEEDYKPIRLNKKLINSQRVLIWISLDHVELKRKYEDDITEMNKRKDFCITENHVDGDVSYVFTDLFAHSKIILVAILKRIPVWDFRYLLNNKLT